MKKGRQDRIAETLTSKLYKSEFFFFVGIVKDYYSANFCNFGMFFRKVLRYNIW